MTCYCKPLMTKLNVKIFKRVNETNFDEFTLYRNKTTGELLKTPVKDQQLYCNNWAINFAIQQSMVVGTSMVVVLINIITCTIFEKIVFVEKRHTVNDETVG
jgi:hypothetical protein